MQYEDWNWWDNQVKTVQSGAYGLASPSGDTILRERPSIFLLRFHRIHRRCNSIRNGRKVFL